MWFGIAAAVGNTIAAGIVRSPGDIAQWLPNVYLFFGVWIVGGLYALVGASSMAELGASIPRSGGQYNFSRRAIGDYAGFIVGWSDWLSTCGTAAAVAIVIAEYSGALFAPFAGHVQSIAVSVIVAFFLLQWRGIKWGSSTQLVTAALKTIAFVVVVVACFVFGGHARNAAPAVAAAGRLTRRHLFPSYSRAGHSPSLSCWLSKRFSIPWTVGMVSFILAKKCESRGAMYLARFSAACSRSWGSIS